jgi:hypothetical protein
VRENQALLQAKIKTNYMETKTRQKLHQKENPTKIIGK